MRDSVVMVKLGGSLITDKRRDGAVRLRVIRRVARELARAAATVPGVRLIVGHGSGSFGHVAASAAGLVRGADARKRLDGISRTQRRAADLHWIVIDALADAGARPFSLAPSSFLEARDGGVIRVFAGPVFEALRLGLLPVVYGDVVLDTSRGATIVSTEEVLAALVRAARRRGVAIRRVVWVGETDGLYSGDGRTIPVVDASRGSRTAAWAGPAAGTDVTGGMTHRLSVAARLARNGVESLLIDGRGVGRLASALAGHSSGGTRVVARPKGRR